MKPAAGDDPYAPPASDPGPQVQESGEGLWRVKAGKLLVRVGAVLPEVCVFDGWEKVPGFRTGLGLRPFSLTAVFVPAPGIVVFQSRQAFLKNLSILIGGPVLGTAAGMASSLAMPWDSSATAASITVSLAFMVSGVAVPIWHLRKMPEINPAEADGWHEVRNVHPRAIACLRSMQSASDSMPELSDSSA